MLTHQLPTQKHSQSGSVVEAAGAEGPVGVAHQAVGRRTGLATSWGLLRRRGSLSQLPPTRWGVEGVSEEG